MLRIIHKIYYTQAGIYALYSINPMNTEFVNFASAVHVTTAFVPAKLQQ